MLSDIAIVAIKVAALIRLATEAGGGGMHFLALFEQVATLVVLVLGPKHPIV